jgi:hypothetical protein
MRTNSGRRQGRQHSGEHVHAQRENELGDCISVRDRVHFLPLVAELPPLHVLVPRAGRVVWFTLVLPSAVASGIAVSAGRHRRTTAIQIASRFAGRSQRLSS